MALTPKQEAFVREYLLDHNATQAAIRAGYSAKTAHSSGPRLLEEVGIRKAILEARKVPQELAQVDAAWLLRRLADESTADLSDLYDEHGGLRPVRDWPLIWRQGLVQGIEVDELKAVDGTVMGTIRKVKLDNRVKRLELIGKHIGVQAFKEQVELSGTVNIADRMSEARRRVTQREDGE